MDYKQDMFFDINLEYKTQLALADKEYNHELNKLNQEYTLALGNLHKKIDISIESAKLSAIIKSPPEQLEMVIKMIESKRGKLIEAARSKLEENINNKKNEVKRKCEHLKKEAMFERVKSTDKIIEERKNENEIKMKEYETRKQNERQQLTQYHDQSRIIPIYGGLASINEPRCPKCKSTRLLDVQKGYSVAKGVVGVVAFGPVGLVGGLIGSKKPVRVCGSCGHRF